MAAIGRPITSAAITVKPKIFATVEATAAPKTVTISIEELPVMQIENLH